MKRILEAREILPEGAKEDTPQLCVQKDITAVYEAKLMQIQMAKSGKVIIGGQEISQPVISGTDQAVLDAIDQEIGAAFDGKKYSLIIHHCDHDEQPAAGRRGCWNEVIEA
jgi:hypothetical protein